MSVRIVRLQNGEDVIADVKEALNDLIYVPFQFENTGSQVIYYQP